MSERLNADVGGPVPVEETGGTVVVDDVRGIGMLGTPSWMALPPIYVPGLVVHTKRDQPVRGAANLTTAPRSFSPSDANP